MPSELRLDHFLCYSDAVSLDDHVAEYRRLGFVPQARAARWDPGLRTRFIGLWPEYLELLSVEDEAAFAASDDPDTRFRVGGRPYSIGIMTDDLPALHATWRERGFELPEVRFESPADSPPEAEPLFAFVSIPQELLPGVSAFALTSYYGPPPPMRRQVWVAPNSVFGLTGLTMVSRTPESDAAAWQRLLGPDEPTTQGREGPELVIGPHRMRWLDPDGYARRYDLPWTPSDDGADGIGLLEMVALDLDRVEHLVREVGRAPRRLDDGALLIDPSDHDGFRFLVRAGKVDEWAAWRRERTGLSHAVVRVDELMARGTPGDGEYVLRSATLEDLPAIRRLGAEVLPETYAAITPDGYVGMLLENYWSDEANRAAIEAANEELLVAESAVSGVIGVAHSAIFKPGSVILWRLYVLGRVRGLGIGSALLAETLRRCPSGTGSFLTEYVTANTDAAAFYARRGFTPLREESERWGDSTIGVTYVERAVARTWAG
ncbi:MAG: GNAT family N-acetyltransferase [Chloroflexota bacterium]|nr:GNAT family N-acetyltransferase [Chloroflexota bacterium]